MLGVIDPLLEFLGRKSTVCICILFGGSDGLGIVETKAGTWNWSTYVCISLPFHIGLWKAEHVDFRIFIFRCVSTGLYFQTSLITDLS